MGGVRTLESLELTTSTGLLASTLTLVSPRAPRRRGPLRSWLFTILFEAAKSQPVHHHLPPNMIQLSSQRLDRVYG